MLGCSPNFDIPGRPQQTGLCERLIETLKNMISKVAADNQKTWHKHFGFVLWVLLEVANVTVGLPPWLLAGGDCQRVPWWFERYTDWQDGETASEYLNELNNKVGALKLPTQTGTNKTEK